MISGLLRTLKIEYFGKHYIYKMASASDTCLTTEQVIESTFANEDSENEHFK